MDETSGQPQFPAPASAEPGRDYARRLDDRIVNWYESAERKAQLILTLDGVFLSFLVGSLVTEPRELGPVLAQFGWETWTLAAMMSLALIASIACAVRCLTSRLMSRSELEAEYRGLDVTTTDPGSLRPEAMWYFQLVANFDRDAFVKRVVGLEPRSETEALAGNSVLLARNVVEKHRWVNRGFLLSGVVLVLFLGTGISYVLRVA